MSGFSRGRLQVAGDDSTLLSLVDVVFVLVFALATMVASAPPSIVDLAHTDHRSSATSVQDDPPPTLQITREGNLVLDGQAIERQQLVQTVQRRLAGRSTKTVLLKPDRELVYQELVAIRDLLTASQFELIEQGTNYQGASKP